MRILGLAKGRLCELLKDGDKLAILRGFSFYPREIFMAFLSVGEKVIFYP